MHRMLAGRRSIRGPGNKQQEFSMATKSKKTKKTKKKSKAAAKPAARKTSRKK